MRRSLLSIAFSQCSTASVEASVQRRPQPAASLQLPPRQPTPTPCPLPLPLPCPIANPIANPTPNPIANPTPNPIANPIPTLLALPLPTPLPTPCPIAIPTLCLVQTGPSRHLIPSDAGIQEPLSAPIEFDYWRRLVMPSVRDSIGLGKQSGLITPATCNVPLTAASLAAMRSSRSTPESQSLLMSPFWAIAPS